MTLCLEEEKLIIGHSRARAHGPLKILAGGGLAEPDLATGDTGDTVILNRFLLGLVILFPLVWINTRLS